MRTADAWEEVRKRNDPKNVRKPKVFETVIKRRIQHGQGRTPVKMGIHPPGSWKPPQDPDRE